MHRIIATHIGSVECVFSASVIMLLTACSAATPSVRDAEAFLQKQVTAESEGRMKLAKFTKTDGQKMEMAGVQLYKMEYAGEVKVLENCKWLEVPFGQASFKTMKPPASTGGGFSWEKWAQTTLNQGVLVKADQQFKISGTLTFDKSEKGWRVNQWTFTTESAEASAPVPAIPQGALATVGTQSGNREQKPASNPFPKTTDEITDLQGRYAKKGQTGLDKCIQNLRNIHIAARIWMTSETPIEPRLPSNFASMSNEISGPQFLTCPSDRSVTPAQSVGAATPKNISYQLVTSGVNPETTDPMKVFVRCPIHHYVCRINGTIEKE